MESGNQISRKGKIERKIKRLHISINVIIKASCERLIHQEAKLDPPVPSCLYAGVTQFISWSTYGWQSPLRPCERFLNLPPGT